MKKPITNFLVAITCALVLLSSCASSFEQAGEALAQGDYTKAIEKSLKSIEKGDDVPAAETVLKDAWQRANSEWNAQIATIEQATTYDELSKVIPVYNKLLAVHKMVAAAGRSELSPTYDAFQRSLCNNSLRGKRERTESYTTICQSKGIETRLPRHR